MSFIWALWALCYEMWWVHSARSEHLSGAQLQVSMISMNSCGIVRLEPKMVRSCRTKRKALLHIFHVFVTDWLCSVFWSLFGDCQNCPPVNTGNIKASISMHEIVWNALQDTNSQSGVTCPFFLLRGAQSSSPYVLDSGRSATWDSYKTDNLATNVTNLHFSAGGSIVQICCANVFLNEFKNRKKKEKRKKQVQQIWFSAKTILFLAWTGSGVATVRQLRLNEHWISRTQWEKTDSRHSWTTVTAVTGSARQDYFWYIRMNEGSKWILVLNGWKWRHFGSGWVMMIGSQIARQQGFNPRHSESCSFFNVQDALLFSVLRCPQMFLEDSKWIDLIIFDWFLGRFLNWKSLQTLKGQRRGPQPTLKLVMVALKKWLLGSQKRSRISLFWGNQTCRISAYRRRVRKHTEGAVRCCLQVYPFVSASSISRGCVVAPNMEHLCGTCWRHRQNCCCGQSQKRHPTTLRRSSAAVESAESLVESRIHKDWLCKILNAHCSNRLRSLRQRR